MKFRSCDYLSKLTIFLFCLVSTAVHSQESSSKVSLGIFSTLKIGQKISFKDSGGHFEISLFNNGEVGSHVIQEIHPTFIVATDIVGVAKLWIPLTSVKSVTWTRIQPQTTRP